MSMSMTLRPKMSEKAYGLTQVRNTYTFIVPNDANKVTIAQAVEAQFKVSVTEVTVMNNKGKAKRTVRKGGRAVAGREAATKKAYVTLKQGDTIAVFATEDEAKTATPDKKEKK